MAKKWYESTVVRIENESEHTRRFWLKIEEETMPFTFKAGQFITMDLPIGEKRRDRWRSYSIANAPDASNVLELCIVKLEGGRASSYLFDEVELGSKIKFKGPDGAFALPANADKDIVLICTGTGVAPFRSMIMDLLQSADTMPNVHLIFGTRTADGILYRAELENLAKIHPAFRYSVALSRVNELSILGKTAMDVHASYVHPIYEQAYANVRENVVFYLCGWSNMVDEAQQKLQAMGYAPNQIVVELYG